jgi:hypothetical protein
MINISMFLSRGEIEILQRWAFDSQENEVIPTHQYIDKLARYYYNQRQFFVFIDDVGSVPRTIKDTQFSTDFIESSSLFHTFSNI